MTPIPPVFGFELASPTMLGWLAAAAAPILLHLWSRRRHRQMPWAAIEYLLAAVTSSRRRLEFEQWLLLAIRTGVVVLVVFAVAEPFLQRARFGFAPGERTGRLLVLDGSYSMGYKLTDKSRFDWAKEVAARIVQQSPQGDGFTLVLMSSPPRVVVGTPAFEPHAFLQEIESLRLPHTTADLPATLVRVEEVLKAARREHPKLAGEVVYFLTDLGRVGWLPELDRGAEAEFRQRSKRLARSAALVVIDLGQPGAENVAVTNIHTSEPFATLGQTVNIEAQMRNYGRQDRKGQLVELLVDRRRVRQQHVDLAAAAESSVAFSYRFETPGDHIVEVRVQGDQLEVDNHRWMALAVKQSIQVLCIDGRPSGEPFGGATDFLVDALSPGGDGPAPPVIRPQVVPESALLELDLGRYDCVFLANVAQFTSSEAKRLDAYLKNGGSLIFFLGDQVLADRYNRELAGQRPGQLCLLPARLGAVVENTQFRLDPLEYRHPIVRPFRDHEGAGLLTTPVNKYFKLIVPKHSQSKVALAMANRDPLIVEGPVDRGRVILVATSADVSSWTPMPVWFSYVPIVQELLAYAIGGQLQQRNFEVGQPLGDSVWPPPSDASLVLQTPDGRNEQLRLATEGEYAGWSFSDTSTSGIYTARLGPPISPNFVKTFAVNVDTAESDLGKLTPEQLRNQVWPDVPFTHQTSWESPNGQQQAQISRRGGLSKGLLYAVLGLLFAETFLARRFGYHYQ